MYCLTASAADRSSWWGQRLGFWAKEQTYPPVFRLCRLRHRLGYRTMPKEDTGGSENSHHESTNCPVVHWFHCFMFLPYSDMCWGHWSLYLHLFSHQLNIFLAGEVAAGTVIGTLLGKVVHLSFCASDERVAACSGATVHVLSSKARNFTACPSHVNICGTCTFLGQNVLEERKV